MKINDKHLIAFANSNAPIDKEGYLQKKGEVNKSFQKRWFIMKGNLLFYFEKRGDREPIGVIILESCTVELGDSTDAFAFDLVFKGGGSRTYTLAAETQEEMETWMKAITCAGYEYMKLMVSELQRQLDELNTVERNQVTRTTYNGDVVPKQMRRSSDMTKQVLRSSSQDKGLLVDVSVPSANTPQVKQEKRIARINPFDTEDYSAASSDTVVIPNAFPNQATERASEAIDLNSRGFGEMHKDFGQYIKKKCNINTYENVFL